MKPEISIITPVWNGLPYIKECIQSVLDQDFQDWELIISDNGSTDGSREYLSSLADPRIKIFLQETNLGIFGNLNFLASQVRARWIKVLCADDYFLPGGLRRVVECWRKSAGNTSFIRHNWHDAKNSAAARARYSARILSHFQDPKTTNLIFFVFGNPGGNLSNVSFNARYHANGLQFRQDLPYAGDFEYWARIGNCGPWRLETDRVTYVRQHANQATRYLNKSGELIRQSKVVTEELYNQLKNEFPPMLLKARGSWNYFRFITQALKAPNKGTISQVFVNLKSPATLPSPLTLLLFAVTLGGKLFTDSTSRLLMERDLAKGARGETNPA